MRGASPAGSPAACGPCACCRRGSWGLRSTSAVTADSSTARGGVLAAPRRARAAAARGRSSTEGSARALESALICVVSRAGVAAMLSASSGDACSAGRRHLHTAGAARAAAGHHAQPHRSISGATKA